MSELTTGNVYNLPTMKPINVRKIIDDLPNILVGKKNYDITSPKGYDHVFIIGKDEAETTIGNFDHPIITDGIRTEKIVVTDIRKYVGNIDGVTTYSELVPTARDKSGLEFMINRAIIAALIDDGSIGEFKNIQNSMAIMFATVITNSIKMYIDLNPSEIAKIEAISAMYVHNSFSRNVNKSDRNTIIKARTMNTKLNMIVLGKKTLDSLSEIINMQASVFSELVANIHLAMPNRATVIKEEVIYNTFTSLWYGPGNVSVSLLHTEDLATMISLYYTALTDSTYKKTRLANILNSVKRKLDDKAINELGLLLRDYK